MLQNSNHFRTGNGRFKKDISYVVERCQRWLDRADGKDCEVRSNGFIEVIRA